MLFASGKARSKAVKEWIIFALCLGLGGHLALALLLHAPEQWPADTLWIYGILLALAVYVCVQLLRSVWWWRRSARPEGS